MAKTTPPQEKDNELIVLLRILDGSRYADSDRVMERGRLINLIRTEANKQLILANGKPNYDLMNRIEKLGYAYFKPLETDGFGWLTAEIRTRKGRIFFG